MAHESTVRKTLIMIVYLAQYQPLLHACVYDAIASAQVRRVRVQTVDSSHVHVHGVSLLLDHEYNY